MFFIYYAITAALAYAVYLSDRELISRIIGTEYGTHLADVWPLLTVIYNGIYLVVLLAASLWFLVKLPLKKEASLFMVTCIVLLLIPEIYSTWWTFYHYWWAAALFYVLFRHKAITSIITRKGGAILR